MLIVKDKTTLCKALAIPSPRTVNPFETYILPLALHNFGLLNAVLGLTACFVATSERCLEPELMTSALQYRLTAIQTLSKTLIHEELFGLNEAEEEHALAIVLMLVLHDVSTC